MLGRFGLGWGGLLGWAESVELFDENKYGKSRERKADDIGEEQSVVERWSASSLGGFKGGVVRAREIPVELGEIDLIENEPEGRHKDIRHEGCDDLAESGSDNDTDGEVDDITLNGERFEFRNERRHRKDHLVFLRATRRLLLDFGERAQRAGAQLDADASNFLRLEVDLECAPGGDIRMASGVSGGGTATGEGAYSAHN